ncbi:MAG TPA: metallophosphoesterase family protein [Acidimicrobiales bacterium]|jgi:3',5'-cyclic AMP phosphodiesterase CpdA
MPVELTTVADDEAVFHDPDRPGWVGRHVGLVPDTGYELEGAAFRTLPRPGGERLSTLATVNDTHFGEVECGLVEGLEIGPVLRAEPGEPPYPEVMNGEAVAEIEAAGVDAVIAKGDLTTKGTKEELDAFFACYGRLGGLRAVLGNHDGYGGLVLDTPPYFTVEVPGLTVAVLDTVDPGRAQGRIGAEQLEWLDTVAAEADGMVLVLGHHHCWDPGSRTREPTYFGINPADSERLVEVVARRGSVVGYAAGHTHRNRVRRFAATGDVPWIEVSSVKDFPGGWAEYRVYEGGVLQVFRRVSTPAALDWSDRTRAMFGGFYPQYSFGRLEDRCFVLARR